MAVWKIVDLRARRARRRPMAEPLLRYIAAAEAGGLLSGQGTEFALIPNGPDVFPPFEVVPLGPKSPQLKQGLRALLFDMDGTTTMTEDLCLHALESFVRAAMGSRGAEFGGMDPKTDFPHIIGHSSTKNIEHLVRTYGDGFEQPAFVAAYVDAIAWALTSPDNPERRVEAYENLEAMAGETGTLMADLIELGGAIRAGAKADTSNRQALVGHLSQRINWDNFDARVRAGLEIYFRTLQDLFEKMTSGEGESVAVQLYGPGSLHPVHPLPGLGVAMALARGFIGNDGTILFDYLLHSWRAAETLHDVDALRNRFIAAARHFAQTPAPVALVTSSGRYEVGVIMPVVFEGLVEEVRNWPVCTETRDRVIAAFGNFENFYSAIVTASDSHEIRLKPYRDLYSIALRRLGISAENAIDVAGFEDTEPGIVAQRAAGVGIPCAVPFEGTLSHNFGAASHVLHGGIAEALLKHALFLPDHVLTTG